MYEITYELFELDKLFFAKNGNPKLTKTYCNSHKGNYEVFSGATKDHFAFIDTYDYDGENLSFSTDGEYAGTIQILYGKYSIGAHRTILIAKDDNINIKYFRFVLIEIIKSKYKKGNVPSVHWRDIKKEKVKVPIDSSGKISVKEQEEIANKYLKIEKYKAELEIKKKIIDKFNISVENDGDKVAYVDISTLFKPTLGSGRYTKAECLKNKGEYPVYSGNTTNEFAYINEFQYDGEYLTWAKDGLAGFLMYHNGKFSITNHRGILLPTAACKNIDLKYIKIILEPIFRRNIKGRLGNEEKNEYTTLSKEMINNITDKIPIPVNIKGEFDLEKQKEIANKVEKINLIKKSLINKIDELINVNIR